MPKRRKLATGIYEDAYGRSVIVSVHGKPKEFRFEKDRPLDLLVRWRKRKIGDGSDAPAPDARGSLARDIVRYLKRLKGTAGYKSERSHLRAWLQRWPSIKRWQISGEMIELAIAAWRHEGYSARTIRHRCRALEALCHRLDGSRAPTPFDDVKVPPKPKPRPVSVSDETINEVARNLRRQEAAGRLRTAQTRARFLVRATTGRRAAEVKSAQREDIQLDRRLWFVRTAKGGVNSAIILNDEMVGAWELFIAANAWGWFDDRSFSKTLKRNGWPKHIPPKNLRHSTAIAIRARGGDLGDVKDQLGHASLQTTEENYLHIVPARQAETSARLAGRFHPLGFQPLPRTTPTNRGRRDAKGPDILRKTERA